MHRRSHRRPHAKEQRSEHQLPTSKTRHNARTCNKDAEISSELDASMTYIGSLFDSDEIEDA
jgi:hypothetical protein